MPKDEAQLYAAIELVVNGALEYLAKDLGIVEQRISLDGNSVSEQSVIKFGKLVKFWKNAKASSLNSITQHNAGIKRGWIQHNAGCMHPSVCVASWMNLVNEFVAGTAVNILVMPKDAFEQGKDLDEFFQSTAGTSKTCSSMWSLSSDDCRCLQPSSRSFVSYWRLQSD